MSGLFAEDFCGGYLPAFSGCRDEFRDDIARANWSHEDGERVVGLFADLRLLNAVRKVAAETLSRPGDAN